MSGGAARAADATSDNGRLVRLIHLSIAAALATIALKTAAWLLTGSVGLLSDAAESGVNLVAALFALMVLHWAARPADAEHAYGHEKAEYLAAGAEGAMIILAAGVIGYAAITRLLDPRELDDIGLGLAVSVFASVINLAVARLLIAEGKRSRSLVLEADGRHLMTDVWTSVGVVVGVAAVAVTGWERLDPIVALLVAANIVVTGVMLIRGFTGGLLDRALPPEERRAVEDVLEGFGADGVRFHALRTRRAGRRAFVSVHVLVPGEWTVQRGHNLAERIEADIRAVLHRSTVFTHLEPIEDASSFADTELDRSSPPATGSGVRADRAPGGGR